MTKSTVYYRVQVTSLHHSRTSRSESVLIASSHLTMLIIENYFDDHYKCDVRVSDIGKDTCSKKRSKEAQSGSVVDSLAIIQGESALYRDQIYSDATTVYCTYGVLQEKSTVGESSLYLDVRDFSSEAYSVELALVDSTSCSANYDSFSIIEYYICKQSFLGGAVINEYYA